MFHFTENRKEVSIKTIDMIYKALAHEKYPEKCLSQKNFIQEFDCGWNDIQALERFHFDTSLISAPTIPAKHSLLIGRNPIYRAISTWKSKLRSDRWHIFNILY